MARRPRVSVDALRVPGDGHDRWTPPQGVTVGAQGVEVRA